MKIGGGERTGKCSGSLPAYIVLAQSSPPDSLCLQPGVIDGL